MRVQLKEIAPEYYETLAYHKSWTWVTWKFLSDPEVGPWTRMRRPTREAAPAPATPDKAAALVRLCKQPFDHSKIGRKVAYSILSTKRWFYHSGHIAARLGQHLLLPCSVLPLGRILSRGQRL